MVKGFLAGDTATREAGAVLNKKNKSALRAAFETIRNVLTGAGINLDETDEDETDAKEAGGFAIADLATLLQSALDRTREAPADPNSYQPPLRIVDIFDDRFVYTEGWSSTFYSVDYAVDESGVVTLSTPSLVIRKVNYIAPGASTSASEAGAIAFDMPTLEEGAVRLVESAIAVDGSARIKLIAANQWGSSGYYSADVLKRDGATAFPAGTKMYIDHDTPAEEAQRPEGTIDRLAATFEEDARFIDDPKHGAGLYARVRVRDAMRSDLDDIAQWIGTSIRAGGKATIGEAQGKRGPIITALVPSKLNRVDFVTVPGAGGKILPLFESLRSRAAVDVNKADTIGANEMTDDQIREAITAGITAGVQAAIAPLQTEVARLRESAALRDASAIVADHLRTIALPAATRDRLVPIIAREAVIDQATGTIDRAKLIEAANAAARDEAGYLTAIGAGRIVGLGESVANNAATGDASAATGEAVEKELSAMFVKWGLTESAATVAARGRTV